MKKAQDLSVAECERLNTNMRIIRRLIAATPCVNSALATSTPKSQLMMSQRRLMTYKEVLLHQDSLDQTELDNAFHQLSDAEKLVAQQGQDILTIAIKEIDGLLSAS
ncbi:hypothetical protein J4N42_21625 [Vibrio sp. SCSIO 43135]|uniref:hypothetical protein n=1 Tax=Vibrio sp. SCSIO 43135 TaxID=2819096 RepID=UPI002075C2C4|nr:hypothetical protein [Vibrio sp. SCSIO 43135]USD43195.1 hypothetical protein J4N42_21625 [Vibrio sp. SCSIO 43135]